MSGVILIYETDFRLAKQRFKQCVKHQPKISAQAREAATIP
jgi:hypothetical protein